MQVTSKDGNRKVKLLRGEHASLVTAQRHCAELADIAQDKEASDAADLLELLCERYAPPPVKPRKNGETAE